MTAFLKQLGKPQLIAILAIMWAAAAILLYLGFGNPTERVLVDIHSINTMIIGWLFGRNLRANETKN